MAKRGGGKRLTVVCGFERGALLVVPGDLLFRDGVVVPVCDVGAGIKEIQRHIDDIAVIQLDWKHEGSVLGGILAKGDRKAVIVAFVNLHLLCDG